MDWREFTKLHALLEAYYPVIYILFEVIPVGRAGLLFHYDSGHPEKTPLVLSAHQDVVEPGALELRKKEPFSGAYEDGIIWGRGTTDCKHLFLAEMEAAFSDGFRPSYDLYMHWDTVKKFIPSAGKTADGFSRKHWRHGAFIRSFSLTKAAV